MTATEESVPPPPPPPVSPGEQSVTPDEEAGKKKTNVAVIAGATVGGVVVVAAVVVVVVICIKRRKRAKDDDDIGKDVMGVEDQPLNEDEVFAGGDNADPTYRDVYQPGEENYAPDDEADGSGSGIYDAHGGNDSGGKDGAEAQDAVQDEGDWGGGGGGNFFE
jgi:hypothetical protein